MNDTRKTTSLAEWTRRISQDEMPIFGRTVQQIIAVAENDTASTAELARVILEDASMTARVLKLANTILYNPRAQNISTVSRAVVVLGFNVVRNLCLSIALVDALVQGAPREHLTRELALALHAAVQARAIAVARGDDSPEEVFIASLLYHLGDLAFWCFAGRKGDELDAAMKKPDYTPEQAQEEVLGFRLHQLTESLVREWNLNELLNSVIRHPASLGERGRNITLSYRIALTAEKGWRDEGMKDVVKQVSGLLKQSEQETRELVHGNAREAARIAAYYGAATAAQIIPMPDTFSSDLDEESLIDLELSSFPQPDGLLQLRILRELSQVLEGKADFNLVMELVMEGIYRGVGMDRTLFGLVTPDRRGLRGKFMLGPGREALLTHFQFTRHPEHTNILFQALDRQESLWVDPAHNPEQRAAIGPAITDVLGRKPFLVGSIVVNGVSIGLFVADRALSGRPIDEETFESFRYFVQQANMGINYVASRRKPKG